MFPTEVWRCSYEVQEWYNPSCVVTAAIAGRGNPNNFTHQVGVVVCGYGVGRLSFDRAGAGVKDRLTVEGGVPLQHGLQVSLRMSRPSAIRHWVLTMIAVTQMSTCKHGTRVHATMSGAGKTDLLWG